MAVEPLNRSDVEMPVVRIRPPRGWASLDLRELWEYRELMYFLVWRDVKVRYKQTALGIAWVVLQPLMTTLIFTVIFGNLAKIPSENLPYAVFALAGLIPWNYFSGAFARGGVSLVGSANLISKVYFPRLVIPISSILGGLIDSAIVFVVLIGLMMFYGITPTWAIVTLPLFLLLAVATALGVSFWLSALNVQYRDVGYLVPFIAQFWIRDAGGLSGEHDPGAVAAALQSESDDRRGGRIPLGALRHGRRSGADAGGIGRDGAAAVGQRRVLFQADGEYVRGCGVNDGRRESEEYNLPS